MSELVADFSSNLHGTKHRAVISRKVTDEETVTIVLCEDDPNILRHEIGSYLSSLRDHVKAYNEECIYPRRKEIAALEAKDAELTKQIEANEDTLKTQKALLDKQERRLHRA